MTRPDRVRIRVRVSGLVQGVGFRPFVWREATARGLCGWVGNDPSGVVMEIEGGSSEVSDLLTALRAPPPLARVDDVFSEPLTPTGDSTFEIRGSETGGAHVALISPDAATCADCWREFHDPGNRRYLHAFINCTSCGPRYTIVRSVPYDRSRTTMAAFPMCRRCQAEYEDPADRRFHAEPVCCPACGPQLRLLDSGGHALTGPPVVAAVDLLRGGSVVAVKGLGGYHLAVDASAEVAVASLRGRKHREDRPFALMVGTVEAAQSLCMAGPEELALLTSAARPIVIMARRPGVPVAPSVAPGAPTLGVMLAYTPLHALLLEAFGGPLVMTSGNASDEPIAFSDDDAVARLGGIADAFLVHDRAVRTRVDDSVVKVVRGRVMPIRRSRGYVPAPIVLPVESPEVVLGMGASLKNTFCVVRGRQAFMSHHVGDLDNYATFESYADGIDHLCALLDVKPAVIAHDLHPEFTSTTYAAELAEGYGARLVGVQHHHAHIASCMVDNGVTEPVIGIAFDGFGLGTDGHAWGGEFFAGDYARGFERAAHLEQAPMPGGDAATREPWRMALAWLDRAYEGVIPAELDVVARNSERWKQVRSLARSGVNSPMTSSAGRLFDAVAAILGIRDSITYEGQAAIELEYAADPADAGRYDASLVRDQLLVSPIVRDVADDLLRGTPVPVVSSRFHASLAALILNVCKEIRAERGLTAVALSGGVFQNALLLARSLEMLEADGFSVLTHSSVPANDGGISLGQAASSGMARPSVGAPVL